MNYLLDRTSSNFVVVDKKAKRRDVFLFVLLTIPFFYPPIFGTSDSFLPIYNLFFYLRFVSLLLSIILFLINIRHILLSKVSIFLLLFSFYLLAITIIFKGDTKTALSFLAQCFSMFVCFSLYFLKYSKKMIAVNVMYYYLLALTIADIILLFFVKDVNLSVLGPKNNRIYYLLPLLFFGIYKDYLVNASKFKFICMSVVALDCVLEFSVTTLFSVGLFLILFALVSFKKRFKLKIKLVIYIALLVSLSLAFMSDSFLKNILNDIVDFFGKADTFGRFEIWGAAAKLIKAKPLFGYGIQDSEVVRMYFSDLNHAHNRYIDVLYMGGIVGLVLFMVSIVCLDTNSLKDKKIIPILLVSYAVLYITEGKRIDAGFIVVLLIMDLIAREKYSVKAYV